MEDYRTQFHIRYVMITFTIRMSRPCTLPPEKASMFRGGFGNCLLDGNCICSVKPPDCGGCSFEQACLIRNIMYASLKCGIPSMKGIQSEGYIFDCADKRTKFRQGDMLSFSITLFGDIIVYLQPILQAVFRMGQAGIGRERAGFEVIGIKNSWGEDLLRNGSVYLKNYRFQYLDDYIFGRIEEFSKDRRNDVKIHMQSPLSLRYQGTMLRVFHAGAFFNSLARRSYIMSCFEGQEDAVQRKWKDGTSWGEFLVDGIPAGRQNISDGMERQQATEKEQQKEQRVEQQQAAEKERQQEQRMEQQQAAGKEQQPEPARKEEGNTEYIPEIEVKECVYREIGRYSSTQKKKMMMCGIEGEFLLKKPTQEMMWYLFAGEILHVGKYSSFGFGKYAVEPAQA